MGFIGQVALATAQEYRAGQGRQPGRHVHDRAAGKVLHTPLEEDSLGMPGPVRQRTVNEQAEQDHEQKIGREPHPLGERSGDQAPA